MRRKLCFGEEILSEFEGVLISIFFDSHPTTEHNIRAHCSISENLM